MRSKAWLKTINTSFICCRFVFTQNWNHFLQGLCFKACSWECFENTVRIRSLCFLVSKVLLNILNRNFKTWKSEFFASALYCCHIWCGTSCKFRFQHFNGWSFWRRLSLHYCQVFLMRLFMISFHLNIFFRELHFPQEIKCYAWCAMSGGCEPTGESPHCDTGEDASSQAMGTRPIQGFLSHSDTNGLLRAKPHTSFWEQETSFSWTF